MLPSEGNVGGGQHTAWHWKWQETDSLDLLQDPEASRVRTLNYGEGGAGSLLITVNPAKGCKDDQGIGPSDYDERLKAVALVRLKKKRLGGGGNLVSVHKYPRR